MLHCSRKDQVISRYQQNIFPISYLFCSDIFRDFIARDFIAYVLPASLTPMNNRT